MMQLPQGQVSRFGRFDEVSSYDAEDIHDLGTMLNRDIKEYLGEGITPVDIIMGHSRPNSVTAIVTWERIPGITAFTEENTQP